jgi:hypothetical protein
MFQQMDRNAIKGENFQFLRTADIAKAAEIVRQFGPI